MVRRAPIEYDRAHDGSRFLHLAPSDIDVHENHVDRLPADFPPPESERRRIHDWYPDRRWSFDAA